METGIKYNPAKDTNPPTVDWLTLPIFRLGQPQNSQTLLKEVTKLKKDGYQLHGHPLIDVRKKPLVTHASEYRPFLQGVTAGFNGIIDSWDVLNELSNNTDLGNYWQAEVFEIMRDICPSANLYLNEYAIQNDQYWDGVIELANSLKNDGLIDGVGIQCRSDITDKVPHAFDYGASLLLKPLSAPKLSNAISAIKQIGLDVSLSEVDVIHSEGQKQSADALIERYRNVGESVGADRFILWS